MRAAGMYVHRNPVRQQSTSAGHVTRGVTGGCGGRRWRGAEEDDQELAAACSIAAASIAKHVSCRCGQCWAAVG
jgi:hypothetical protein